MAESKIVGDWEIYYADESVFTNRDGLWSESPSDGVLIVVEWKSGNKTVNMGMDYYLMRDGEIISFGEKSLHQHMTLGLDPKAVKFGVWTSDEIWERVHGRIF